MRKKYLIIAFALMILAQLSFPLKMIIEREIILHKGETFLFKIEPIDPYDAFRGRYVWINYKNLNVDLPSYMQNEYYKINDLYITLKKDSVGVVIYDKVIDTKPTNTDIYIKVKTDGILTDGGKVRIEMPDNRYYMNENKAPIADTLLKNAYAQIVIYKGQMVLKGILVDGMSIEKYIDQLAKDKSY